MPLNATTYLTEHGWAGKGVPLDGAAGRGLKKPLALPMKRGLKGLGKERDRAVEWWDCVFEAGAKKLGGNGNNDKSAGAANGKATAEADVITAETVGDAALSLEARAKRAFARRMLMNGFVRGKPDVRQQKQQEELERVLNAQEEQRRQAGPSRLETSEVDVATNGRSHKSDKKGKRKAKDSVDQGATGDEAAAKAKALRKEAKRRKRSEEKEAAASQALKLNAEAENAEHSSKKRRRKEDSESGTISKHSESTSKKQSKSESADVTKGHATKALKKDKKERKKNRDVEKLDKEARRAAKKAAKVVAAALVSNGADKKEKTKSKKDKFAKVTTS